MANEFKTWNQEKRNGGDYSAPMSLRSGYGGVIETGLSSGNDIVIVTTLGKPVIFEMNNARYRELQKELHDWSLSSMLGSHGPSKDLANYAIKKRWNLR